MDDHLFDHVRPYLDRSLEDRIAYIRSPRWIGHHGAKQALERLNELMCRPPALRTGGLMLVGPYANAKTMIAERFSVTHLKTCESQRVWVVQTREGAGLAHFYGSILGALRAPMGNSRDVGRKAEQVDHLLDGLKPKILIFDEVHNALRGRSRDVEAVLAFLRRIGRQFDISPVLIGEVAVYDFINATDEMASRFELLAAAAMAMRRGVPGAPRQSRKRPAARAPFRSVGRETGARDLPAFGRVDRRDRGDRHDGGGRGGEVRRGADHQDLDR